MIVDDDRKMVRDQVVPALDDKVATFSLQSLGLEALQRVNEMNGAFCST